MVISKLIELLKEKLETEGDNEVVLEIDGVDYFPIVYDVTGKWSTFDRSKYDGSAPVCFIHGERN
jgi:hypothetical protein